MISFTSLIKLVTPLLLLIPQLIEVAFKLPPVFERFGTFTLPIKLPVWLNIALTIGGAAAGCAQVQPHVHQ
ncbi:hypothetical protein ACFOY2_33100 [Nonomuraea purpurea]|uniref:Uncharacterized protein n=1 Tax=Nonomuraea purpurea TaxID=1849276 RepID=A0ABV8GGZ9_9ACTN